MTPETLNDVFIVMNLEEKDLKDLINLGKGSGISEEHIRVIMYNILCSIKFFHSANIVHRDLKPANILVNNSCQVMICDFGLSRTMPESCIGQGSMNSKRLRDSIYR